MVDGNIFINGPRAGINFNDGFGGGNAVTNNLFANQCRQSGDHGQRHALIGCFGQHRRPAPRSSWLLWPTPQASGHALIIDCYNGCQGDINANEQKQMATPSELKDAGSDVASLSARIEEAIRKRMEASHFFVFYAGPKNLGL